MSQCIENETIRLSGLGNRSELPRPFLRNPRPDENDNSIAHWLSKRNFPLLDPLRTATSLSTVSCVPAGESVVLGLGLFYLSRYSSCPVNRLTSVLRPGATLICLGCNSTVLLFSCTSCCSTIRNSGWNETETSSKKVRN